MTQPPESGPPPPQWGPPPNQWGPPPNQWGPPHQGRPQDRGPSRRKLWLVLAGVGVLITVILLAVGGQPSQPAPRQSAPGQPAPSKTGNQGSPDTGQTNSYTAGYWWAYNNKERLGDRILFTGVHTMCASAAPEEAPVQGLNEQEWTQGCEEAWKKMGYGQTPTSTSTIPNQTPTGPPVDCSKPENVFNGHCF